MIALFEDFGAGNRTRRDGAAETKVDQALDLVLHEIDENARATFSSITLATMLQLVSRQKSDTAS